MHENTILPYPLFILDAVLDGKDNKHVINRCKANKEFLSGTLKSFEILLEFIALSIQRRAAHFNRVCWNIITAIQNDAINSMGIHYFKLRAIILIYYISRRAVELTNSRRHNTKRTILIFAFNFFFDDNHI